jgi:hypothetical protein
MVALFVEDLKQHEIELQKTGRECPLVLSHCISFWVVIFEPKPCQNYKRFSQDFYGHDHKYVVN